MLVKYKKLVICSLFVAGLLVRVFSKSILNFLDGVTCVKQITVYSLNSLKSVALVTISYAQKTQKEFRIQF